MAQANWRRVLTTQDDSDYKNSSINSSDFTHDSLSGVTANEHIDWTTDQGATNIHAGNYTNTTYTVGDGGLTQKNFTTTLKDKLDDIEDSANNYSHPSYNGDDFSIDTGHLSGATVIDDIDINVTTDGQGHVTDANATVATRDLTLADLDYTGATNANYITNTNQLTNGAGYITSYVNTVDMGDGFKIANSAGTDQFTVTENEEIRFAGSGATSVAFDAATQKVTISSTDNNTTYSVGDGGLTEKNFTAADNTKLDGIAQSANNYTHPTGAGNEHLPSTVSQTEAGYLDGVTSAIQTQINSKTTEAYVNAQVAGIVDSAPEQLNTLNELAAAIGDNESYAVSVTTALSARAGVQTGSGAPSGAPDTGMGTVAVDTATNSIYIYG